jgi:uncharacterized protein (DUF58 family)
MIGEMWWMLLMFLFCLSVLLRYDVLLFATLLLALASGASLLSFRHCLRGVVYRRRLQEEYVFCGEETELTIEVTNAKPLPLAWLLIRDRLPPGLVLLANGVAGDGQRETSPPELRDMLVLRRYERIQRTYRVCAHHRGVYTFDSVDLTAGNLFGLEHKSTRLSKANRLIVYPKVVPVEGLALPLERPAGRMKARRRIVEDPLRIASVREYVPGDSVRYIHWKNTARRNQLQTKTFDPEASQVLTLFVDLQTSHDPYSSVSEYLELIVSSAASIAVHALGQRHSVGLCVNGGPPATQGWTSIPPGRHPRQGTRILEALAPLEGFRTLSLSQLLRQSMPVLPYGSTVLVITARMTELVLLALLALEDAGHPAALFTVGDRRPVVPEMFTTYHLGGRDAWRNLEALALA